MEHCIFLHCENKSYDIESAGECAKLLQALGERFQYRQYTDLLRILTWDPLMLSSGSLKSQQRPGSIQDHWTKTGKTNMIIIINYQLT